MRPYVEFVDAAGRRGGRRAPFSEGDARVRRRGGARRAAMFAFCGSSLGRLASIHFARRERRGPPASATTVGSRREFTSVRVRPAALAAASRSWLSLSPLRDFNRPRHRRPLARPTAAAHGGSPSPRFAGATTTSDSPPAAAIAPAHLGRGRTAPQRAHDPHFARLDGRVRRPSPAPSPRRSASPTAAASGTAVNSFAWVGEATPGARPPGSSSSAAATTTCASAKACPRARRVALARARPSPPPRPTAPRWLLARVAVFAQRLDAGEALGVSHIHSRRGTRLRATKAVRHRASRCATTRNVLHAPYGFPHHHGNARVIGQDEAYRCARVHPTLLTDLEVLLGRCSGMVAEGRRRPGRTGDVPRQGRISRPRRWRPRCWNGPREPRAHDGDRALQPGGQPHPGGPWRRCLSELHAELAELLGVVRARRSRGPTWCWRDPPDARAAPPLARPPLAPAPDAEPQRRDHGRARRHDAPAHIEGTDALSSSTTA